LNLGQLVVRSTPADPGLFRHIGGELADTVGDIVAD